ncbi:hypothetical protein [Kribbella sp. NPDC051620]|uniref:hypothetical protein n=1 Tax=Kribbella sp. NPDC051620 TaxID=3364120 RepID=UPI003787ABEA
MLPNHAAPSNSPSAARPIALSNQRAVRLSITRVNPASGASTIPAGPRTGVPTTPAGPRTGVPARTPTAPLSAVGSKWGFDQKAASAKNETATAAAAE